MKNIYLFCVASAIILSACGGGADDIKLARITVNNYSGANPDLKTIYEHYDRNDPRFDAVCFLLANSPDKYSGDDREQLETYIQLIDSIAQVTVNEISASDRDRARKAAGRRQAFADNIYDYTVLNADSLFKSIDCAFEIWNTAPWRKEYDFDHFLEYVLPYRVSVEPLEYYWRWDALSRYNVQGDDMLDVARRINNNIKFVGDPLFRQAGLQGYSLMLRSRFGKCDDRAVLLTMALRAHGIPAAYDFVPQWGGYHTGHSVCSVLRPDGTGAVFHNVNDDGENTFFQHKTSKIYRKMYSIQRNTILHKRREKEQLPPIFSSLDIKDVTSTHAVGFADLRVDIPTSAENKIAYIGVFSASGWTPVAYAENRGAKSVFEAVGTGTDASGNVVFTGEDIGRGILYMPCFYTDDEMIPVANPVIHGNNSQRIITADASNTERVVLKRKFPRLKRIINFAEQMTGGVFEGANRPDFSDAKELHYITTTPLSRMQRVEIESPESFRYVRYRKPKGAFALGEMTVLGKDGQQIPGKVVAYDLLAKDNDINNIADGDPLTFFSVTGMMDVWAGLDFGKPVQITALEFCPRTDDNDVSPGDMYELFYWDDGWVGLGVQQATNYELTYNAVPVGALLWLRDLTRGREERPFTYDDGKQIWW